MSVSLPLGFRPSSFSMQLNTVQRGFSSPYGGSMQVVDLLNDCWTVSLGLPPRTHANAGALDAFINSLRGMTQVVYLHNFARPVPKGTMRGTRDCSFAVVGSDQINIYAPAGSTLLAGDMIGVGGMLLQVREDAIADGAGQMLTKLVTRTRKFIAEGSVVTWDRPSAAFRCVSTAAVQYVPGYAEGLTLDFIEDVTL